MTGVKNSVRMHPSHAQWALQAPTGEEASGRLPSRSSQPSAGGGHTAISVQTPAVKVSSHGLPEMAVGNQKLCNGVLHISV